MIKFFRKIRQNLLSEGKTGKYLKYAIGEIVLVVIGILIALWLNNLNQEKAEEADFHAILVKIQDDMIDDTYFSSWLINRYIVRDSLKDRIFSNAINFDQLSDKDKGDILSMSISWTQYHCKTEGYNQLIDNIYEVPEKYSRLISRLNDLYITRKRDIETMNMNTASISEKFKDYLANNEPWYAEDRYDGKTSDASINFFKNNPIFKSNVMRSHEALGTLMWAHSNYSRREMEMYIMINEMLGDKAREVPDRIRVTSVKNEKDGESLIGTYELKAGSDNTSYGKTIEVRQEGKNLFVSSDKNQNPFKLLFYDKDKPWFGVEATPYILRFESQGKNTLSVITGGENKTQWIKTSPL